MIQSPQCHTSIRLHLYGSTHLKGSRRRKEKGEAGGMGDVLMNLNREEVIDFLFEVPCFF